MPLEYVLLFIVIMLLLIVFSAWVSRFFMKRAMLEVVEAFRREGALDQHNAKTRPDLGLEPKPLLQRMGKMRDYKVHAFDVLRQLEVIRVTDDEKLYLSEKALEDSNLKSMLYPNPR